MPERQCDILIIGGGLGGVAAALAAAQLGKPSSSLKRLIGSAAN